MDGLTAIELESDSEPCARSQCKDRDQDVKELQQEVRARSFDLVVYRAPDPDHRRP